MKVKRAIYIILLTLFSLILAADAALLFLVPEGAGRLTQRCCSWCPRGRLPYQRRAPPSPRRRA